MIKVPHLGTRASRPMPAAPGASPALTPSHPDAGPLRSDRRPGQHPAVPTRSPVPLRRKRPAGTRGSGDIDKPSAVTGRARSIGDRAASEIDAPGPRLTPACGGRTRRPRTEEWPLPDDHPRCRCQLGALDPRSPITEEGLTTVPLPPPTELRQSSRRSFLAWQCPHGPIALRRARFFRPSPRPTSPRPVRAPATVRARLVWERSWPCYGTGLPLRALASWWPCSACSWSSSSEGNWTPRGACTIATADRGAVARQAGLHDPRQRAA